MILKKIKLLNKNVYEPINFVQTYLAQISTMKDTIMYVVPKYNQTSNDSGSKKENLLGSSGTRSLKSILIPVVMNGVEKSTTLSRSDVMLRSQITISIC